MKKAIKKITVFILVFSLLLPFAGMWCLNATAAGRNTVLHVWLSDSKMGDCPEYAINGFRYYLCFELYDTNTGTRYNNYSGGNYKTTMTFYKPNGSVAFSHTYDNSDYNWIAHQVNTTGTYKGVVSLSGSINGSCAISFSSRNADLKVKSWPSKTKMGSECVYFDRSDSCYYCYKLYDANTNVLLDKLLPSKNYTVTESFCNASGQTLYSHSYNNDSNWYGLTNLSARSSYILKLNITGDFNASVQRTIHTKYYSGSETYSFCNSRTDFLGAWNATGKYYMQNKEYNTLVNKICSHYWYSSGLALNNIAKVKAERDSDWGGSCYGMSVTTILDKYNQIGMNENFGTNSYGSVASMNRIARPYSNKTARSAINYYQISQCLGFTLAEQTYKRSSSNWSTGLRGLVNAVKNNNLVLFGFYWYDPTDKKNHGHSIVLQYTYVDGNGNNIILAYDPNEPGGTTVVTINSSFTSCRVGDYTSNPKSIDFTTNFSNLNRIDIDGSNNVYKSSSVSYQNAETDDIATISFDLTGDTTIYNESGHVLNYNADLNYTGTMDVISEKYVQNGPEMPMTVILEVENSKSFSFESTGDELNVSVVSKNIFASADSKNSKSIVIAEDEGLYVLGSKFDCSAYLTYNDKGDMINYNGTSIDNDLIVQPNRNGVTVFGTSDKCEVTRFFGDEQKSYSVDPHYSSFNIECDSDSNYTTFAGSNDDIHYDQDVESKEAVPIEEIHVSKEELSITLGQKYDLDCTVYPDDATDKSVIWASSDESVATVNENGLISTVGVGETIVSVMSADGSALDECKVVVNAPPVSGIEVETSEINLKVGESAIIGATVKPTEALNKNVSWKSKDESVAVVAEDGTITAKSLGTTIIEVSTDEGKYKADIKVNVVPTEVAGIITDDTNISLSISDTVCLSATVLPLEAENRNVQWYSSDTSVVTVDPEGNATAVGAGKAIITVRTQEGNFETEINIEVIPVAVEGVIITSSGNSSLKEGETLKLEATVLPDNATNTSIRWISSDESIVTVDQEGTVTAIHEGNAIVAAITEDGGFTASYEFSVTSQDDVNTCVCNCHKSGRMRIVWIIMRLIYKLLSIRKICDCGVSHY